MVANEKNIDVDNWLANLTSRDATWWLRSLLIRVMGPDEAYMLVRFTVSRVR